MNKLDIVKELISEIEAEQKMFVDYKKDQELAAKKAKQNNDGYYWKYTEWLGRYPVKSRIKQNVLMARRMLLEISREGEK